MRNPGITRRRFIAASAASLAYANHSFGGGSDRDALHVPVLFTTDLHGHIVPTTDYQGNGDLGGFARCASFIRAARREFPSSLLVDVGDVYQGTTESFLSEGSLMMGLFNRLNYDAWVLGNHDFDWGREILEANLERSRSKVLTGNLSVDGATSDQFPEKWRKVLPWTIKEVDGIKIGLVGLTTPGLPYWLAPETLGGVAVLDPVESLKRSVAAVKANGANVVVVTGHMGYRFRDDFANPLSELFRRVPEVDVFLAGHTHQNRPSWELNGVLCSQAGYHGIHCGRLDLIFDRERKRLISKSVSTVLMDASFELDPGVMEEAEPHRKRSAEHLKKRVAAVKERIAGKGRGSRLAMLLCEVFATALKGNGMAVDGVFHGTFGTGDLEPGEITVADCWKLLPYENRLVVAEVSAGELVEIVKEDRRERNSDRTLWPFLLEFDAAGEVGRFEFDGRMVRAGERFRIGFNSYDAQSGGQKLMRLREILEAPEARRRMTEIETRSALIDGFLNLGELR